MKDHRLLRFLEKLLYILAGLLLVLGLVAAAMLISSGVGIITTLSSIPFPGAQIFLPLVSNLIKGALNGAAAGSLILTLVMSILSLAAARSIHLQLEMDARLCRLEGSQPAELQPQGGTA